MPKHHLSPKYNPSSRKRKPIQDTRLDSYRRQLVYQWLNDVRCGDDPVGRVVILIRGRMDPPNPYVTKKHMRTHLERCGFDQTTVETVLERMWVMWRGWKEFKRQDMGSIR